VTLEHCVEIISVSTDEHMSFIRIQSSVGMFLSIFLNAAVLLHGKQFAIDIEFEQLLINNIKL